MIQIDIHDVSGTVYVIPDPRGESETYTAHMLVCVAANGRQVWCEGIRKDWRESMRDMWVTALSKAGVS